jgi:hypothetical protein
MLSDRKKSSKTMPRDHRLTFIFALLVIFAGGCGNDKPVTYNSSGMTQTWSEGKQSVPKDFQLPLYPGATATGSISAEGDREEQAKFVILNTTDSIDKVNDFYQEELKKSGWSIDNIQNMGKLISISVNQKGIDGNVNISDDSGKTTISLELNKATETKKEDEEPAENFAPDKVTPPTD